MIEPSTETEPEKTDNTKPSTSKRKAEASTTEDESWSKAPTPGDQTVNKKELVEKTSVQALTKPGLLDIYELRFKGLYSMCNANYIVVDTRGMTDFYRSLYNVVLQELERDGATNLDDIITEAQFKLVCRYLTKARIDHVYSSCSGHRMIGRIALPRNLEVPKALADIVNGIGTVNISFGAYIAIPQPEAQPGDVNAALHTAVTHEMLTNFSAFTHSAHERGIIRTGFLSSSTTGTAWWLLSPRDAFTPANIAKGLTSVVAVYGAFNEWTPSDGFFCAVVRRYFDGATINNPVLLWTMSHISNVSKVTAEFCSKA